MKIVAKLPNFIMKAKLPNQAEILQHLINRAVYQKYMINSLVIERSSKKKKHSMIIHLFTNVSNNKNNSTNIKQCKGKYKD